MRMIEVTFISYRCPENETLGVEGGTDRDLSNESLAGKNARVER